MLIVRSLVLVRLSAAVLSALWITAAQLGEQRRESGMGRRQRTNEKVQAAGTNRETGSVFYIRTTVSVIFSAVTCAHACDCLMCV